MKAIVVMAAAAAAMVPAPAAAAEVFGGVLAHGVDTPLSLDSQRESGLDVQFGVRGAAIGHTPLQPYLFGSLHTKGDTHFVAAGLSARFGNSVYVRPGLGVAVHSGSAANFKHPDHDHIDFGSRVLFAPEVSVGARVGDRASVEAAWVHLSHAQLFGKQNPGMDSIGLRVNYGF